MALRADRPRHRHRLPRQADQAGNAAVGASSISAAAATTSPVATTAVAAAITACVAAGVAEPVRTAVERRIREIAATLPTAAAVLAQRLAVGLIDEPVGD